MTDTINNGIPLVPENTIDPAAGLNEALNVADALIQVDVISLTVATPPASPVVGDRYIVPTGAAGAWSGQARKLARWEEGLFWAFYNAQFVTNNGVAYTKTSGGWAVISGSGEANTTSNLGAGEGIAAPKSGVNLPFKSLTAGSNVTITSDANEITISSTGGGGGSSVWGGITGDIDDQADLADVLDSKESKLTAGANITINRTDPLNPVISSAGGGGGGDVVGPSSSVDNQVALFSGTTGKLIKSGPLLNTIATVNGQPERTVTASGNITPSDSGYWIVCNNTSAITLTISAESSGSWAVTDKLPAVNIISVGSGTVTVAGASGVTVSKHSSDTLVLDGAGSVATAVRTGSNQFFLFGRLAAV